MYVRLLEHREGEPVNIQTHWDFATMDFSQKAVVKDMDMINEDDDDAKISY